MEAHESKAITEVQVVGHIFHMLAYDKELLSPKAFPLSSLPPHSGRRSSYEYGCQNLGQNFHYYSNSPKAKYLQAGLMTVCIIRVAWHFSL